LCPIDKWANTLRARRISIDTPAIAKHMVDDDVNVSLTAEWIIEVGALKEDMTGDKAVRVFVDLGLGKNIWKGVNVASVGKKQKGDLGIKLGW
jgi:hypothetical protein